MIIQENQFRKMKSFSLKEEKDPYEGTELFKIKQLSSRTKGAFFEHFTKEALKNKGFQIEKPKSSDHDFILSRTLKVEVKGSFLWNKVNTFRSQQIRSNQDYDLIIFLAAYPRKIVLYGAYKQEAMKFLQVQNSNGEWIHNQHGGKGKNSGTFFIDCLPENVSWMKELSEIL